MRWLAVLAVTACAVPPPLSPIPANVLPLVEATADLDGAVVGPSNARATLVITLASWCAPCHDELVIIAKLRATHPGLRVLGLNYIRHEEYDHRGNPAALRAYVTTNFPWLRVVPADEALFAAFGRPPKIPTMFVFDHGGALITTYDGRRRVMPDAAELEIVLRRLGG